MIKMFHFTSIYTFDRILKSNALLPVSYSDVHYCEFIARRVYGKNKCQHNHGYVPNVLWLTQIASGTKPQFAQEALELYPKLREAPQWSTVPRLRFTVTLPSTAVLPWHEYALQHGADPEWAAQRQNEYVTMATVPARQWLEIKDMETGQTVARNSEGRLAAQERWRKRVTGIHPLLGTPIKQYAAAPGTIPWPTAKERAEAREFWEKFHAGDRR